MPEPRIERPRFCAQCGTPVVVADANFCKNCGSPLTWISRDISWRPMLALLLSVIPGLGQLYKGQPGRALVWFIFVLMLLVRAWPVGLLLWMICAANAALGGAIREEAIENSARHRRRLRRRGSHQMTAEPPG